MSDQNHAEDVTPSIRPEATVSPAQAARALKVRRETVHRWMKAGRLAYVLEKNAQGREVRRVPLSAIEKAVGDGVRDDTTPVVDVPAVEQVIVPDPAQTARLLLVEKTVATLEAERDVLRKQAVAAREAVAVAQSSGWWGRGRRVAAALAAADTALAALADGNDSTIETTDHQNG